MPRSSLLFHCHQATSSNRSVDRLAPLYSRHNESTFAHGSDGRKDRCKFRRMSKQSVSLLAIPLAIALLLQLTTTVHEAPAQYIGSTSPVGVPRFHLSDGSTTCAGKAFAIQWFHGKTLLICPLHLLGPGAGYPTYIEAKDVPEKVSSIDVLDFTGKSVVATAQHGLLRTGWPVEKARGDITGDMMAFELQSGSRLPILALAPDLVPVGTKVWVLSKNMPANSQEIERFPGVVTRSFNTGVTVALEGKLTALGSSGSPVVNAKNEVVCMMVGKESQERTIIMGIPSNVLYARLCHEIPR
jgi:hypothetical protein